MAKKNHQDNEDTIPEKDSVELALEKIVFGDLDGFESGLRSLDIDYEETDRSSSDREEEVEEEDDEDLANVQDSNLFFIDEGEQSGSGDENDEDSDESGEDSSSEESSDESDAWQDSDDEKMQVSLVSSDRLKKLRKSLDDEYVDGRDYTRRLRARFEKIYAPPKWAIEDRKRANGEFSDEDDEDNEMDVEDEDSDTEVSKASNPLAKLLSKTTQYITSAAPKLLPPGQLDISRLKDANQAAVSHSAIQAMAFHPTHPLLVTTGYDRTLRIYHIDGKNNALASSLHIRRSPFQTAQFHIDGRRVLAGGRRRYLYIWDIETGSATKISRMFGHEDTQRSMEKFKLSPCGRYIGLVGSNGWVNILSATSGKWVAGAKVEGVIADLAWHRDGNKLLIVNTTGEVWQWDSTARQFTARWRDEGGIGTTTIAIGGKDDRWCAIGSQSGIVNVYDTLTFANNQDNLVQKPRASLGQLVTTVSTLQFSPDGQMLLMASRAKRDALRLVHVPSFTVFSNWPTSATPLGRVTSAAFSPGGEMLCTGNEGGHARLWKLNHYG